jgi:nucleoside-diphosphate-sugar epimerase
MSANDRILVIGSAGQIGTELVTRLREIYNPHQIIASDIRAESTDLSGPYEQLNVLNASQVKDILQKHKITEVYLLAAMLSATGEKQPLAAWDLNVNGLFNILEAAREGHINKLYWPSSIAVFGPTTPKINTPQLTIAEPSTVYGISKLAGERWCEYYFNKYGVDVRSLRYPGLISWKSAPGGGTTDYAVHIFHEALQHGKYDCFLSENTRLPMMYMPDGIRATINLMQASASRLSIRSSYNLAGISFTPAEIATEIKKHIPEFEITYSPDFRQAIAESWPESINDAAARNDWGWNHEYNLSKITTDMLQNLKLS